MQLDLIELLQQFHIEEEAKEELDSWIGYKTATIQSAIL